MEVQTKPETSLESRCARKGDSVCMYSEHLQKMLSQVESLGEHLIADLLYSVDGPLPSAYGKERDRVRAAIETAGMNFAAFVAQAKLRIGGLQ